MASNTNSCTGVQALGIIFVVALVVVGMIAYF